MNPTPVFDPEMVLIPSGWFWMGQEDGPEPSRPGRRVYLDAFAIDRTEVTNAEFERFLSETGYLPSGWEPARLKAAADLPASGVIWRDAQAYCEWAGKRLPSEAEWEKAARGADRRRYPWGDAWDHSKANTAESEVGGLLPVGSFPEGASPYGVLDMAGNAAEWVADYYDADYYSFAPDRNPTGPEKVLDHGLRGGSWASTPEQVQTFIRDSSHSVRPNPRVGFRCAKTVDREDDIP